MLMTNNEKWYLMTPKLISKQRGDFILDYIFPLVKTFPNKFKIDCSGTVRFNC